MAKIQSLPSLKLFLLSGPQHVHYLNYNGNIIPATEAPGFVEGSVFRFQQGLFESMLVKNDFLQLYDYHYERLMKGSEHFALTIPSFFNLSFFVEETLRTIAHNTACVYHRVRFQIAVRDDNFSYLIETSPLEKDIVDYNKTGWTLGLIDLSLKEFDRSGNLKLINIPLYTKGAALATAQGWNDVLLTYKGQIVESGGANIFWVRNRKIFTPPLAAGCIEGTMRRFLIGSLQGQYEFHEARLYKDDLLTADEVFLTNAIRRIKWVRQIDNSIYSNALSAELYGTLFPEDSIL